MFLDFEILTSERVWRWLEKRHQRYFTSVHPKEVKVHFSSSHSSLKLYRAAENAAMSPTVGNASLTVVVLLWTTSPAQGTVCLCLGLWVPCSLQSTLGWHGLPLAPEADTRSGHWSGLSPGLSCCRRHDGVMKDLQNCSNSAGIRVIMLGKMNFILLWLTICLLKTPSFWKYTL